MIPTSWPESWARGRGGCDNWRAAADLTRAIDLGLRVAADRERVLGADHPDTLRSRNNLAGAYRSAGRLDEAIALYERTLADRERVLGADHPDTLTSRNNLAGAYQSAGRLERGDRAVRADPHRPRAGPGRRPPRHPGLAQQPRRRLRVGGAARAGDRAVRADPRRPRAGAGRRPPRHPDLPQQPRLRLPVGGAAASEAIALYERTLADRERVLGPDHPDTLTSRNNLACAYQSAGTWTRRSRCTSRPSPTASGSWAPTTPTP